MAKSKSGSVHKRGASRDVRSASPVKEPEPSPAKSKTSRKTAHARKPSKKAAKAEAAAAAAEEELEDELAAAIEEEEEEDEEAAEEAAAEIAALIEAAEELEAEEEEALPADTVRVAIQQDVEDDGKVTTTHTSVKVDIPADSPDLELPKDTEGMVKVAAQLVEDARAVREAEVEEVAAANMLKRKAEVLDDDVEGPEEVVEEVVPAPIDSVLSGDIDRPAKRTRVMVPAEEYRRERVKRRAMIGVSSALAVGVLVPFISNLF